MTWPTWSHTFLLRCLIFSAALMLSAFYSIVMAPSGIQFTFKDQKLILLYPMRRDPGTLGRRAGLSNAQLDTLSNWYSPVRKYVEIIRQDHPLQPHYGIALGFEFDGEFNDYPYTPAYAKLQLKDFTWGGVEFSLVDSCNFTGVSNDVSNDLSIQVEGYQNDTIFGRFSGLLLSAAGPMAQLDSGYFRVFVHRVE